MYEQGNADGQDVLLVQPMTIFILLYSQSSHRLVYKISENSEKFLSQGHKAKGNGHKLFLLFQNLKVFSLPLNTT